MYTGKGGTIQSTREKRQWQNDELVLIKIWWRYCSTWTPITARKMVLLHKISPKDTVWMTDLLLKMGSKPHEWQFWSASRIWLDTTQNPQTRVKCFTQTPGPVQVENLLTFFLLVHLHCFFCCWCLVLIWTCNNSHSWNPTLLWCTDLQQPNK